MRWKVYYPKDGEVRIVKKFLFFPLEINCKNRWLEFTTIKQKYHKRTILYDISRWKSIEFINK